MSIPIYAHMSASYLKGHTGATRDSSSYASIGLLLGINNYFSQLLCNKARLDQEKPANVVDPPS